MIAAAVEAGAEHGAGARRLGDRRSARRDPGGGRAGRRPDRAFRHAGRSRQYAAARPARRAAGARPAGLRPLAEGQRLRLGAGTALRRGAGRPRGHHAHGRGRAARRNPVAPAAARRGQPATGRAESGESPPGPRIAALLLAAGRSTRMGGPNKLLEPIDGTPMVARTATRLLASRARPIVAVLGNQADAIDRALGKLPVERVRNPAFAEGLSTSLKCGLAALPNEIDGVVVCLGDMPLITGRDIDRLIAAFNPLEGRAIIVPTRRGKRGNPVLWAKRFFAEMAELAGDVGAKHLIGEHAELVCEVEMDTDGVLVDIDTPEALAEFRGKIKPSAA